MVAFPFFVWFGGRWSDACLSLLLPAAEGLRGPDGLRLQDPIKIATERRTHVHAQRMGILA